MLATTSVIPTLKGTLRDRLNARPSLKTTFVGWGWPKAPGKEMLLLGDFEGEQTTKAMRAGRHVRREAGSLEVVVYVERGGADQEGTTKRAYEIAAELENELRDDPTVGATVQSAVIGGPFHLEERADPKGLSRLAILTLAVEIQARLT